MRNYWNELNMLLVDNDWKFFLFFLYKTFGLEADQSKKGMRANLWVAALSHWIAFPTINLEEEKLNVTFSKNKQHLAEHRGNTSWYMLNAITCRSR